MLKKGYFKDLELIVFLAFSFVLTIAVFLLTNTILGIYSVIPSIGTLLACIHFGRKKLA
jgi:hypothetical protein